MSKKTYASLMRSANVCWSAVVFRGLFPLFLAVSLVMLFALKDGQVGVVSTIVINVFMIIVAIDVCLDVYARQIKYDEVQKNFGLKDETIPTWSMVVAVIIQSMLFGVFVTAWIGVFELVFRDNTNVLTPFCCGVALMAVESSVCSYGKTDAYDRVIKEIDPQKLIDDDVAVVESAGADTREADC